MKKILICFILFFILTINFQCNASFEEYYEEWKKEHGITQETPYSESNNKDFQIELKSKIIQDLEKDISKKQEQIDKLNNKNEKMKNKYLMIIIVISSINIILLIIMIFYLLKIKKK